MIFFYWFEADTNFRENNWQYPLDRSKMAPGVGHQSISIWWVLQRLTCGMFGNGISDPKLFHNKHMLFQCCLSSTATGCSKCIQMYILCDLQPPALHEFFTGVWKMKGAPCSCSMRVQAILEPWASNTTWPWQRQYFSDFVIATYA